MEMEESKRFVKKVKQSYWKSGIHVVIPVNPIPELYLSKCTYNIMQVSGILGGIFFDDEAVS